MSKNKHNYSQYSKQNNTANEPAAEFKMELNPIEQPAEVETVAKPEPAPEPTPTPAPQPVIKKVRGMVANCAKLNVRALPDKSSAIKCVLKRDDRIEIDPEKSTAVWYAVRTGLGVKGYCMKDFITVKN